MRKGSDRFFFVPAKKKKRNFLTNIQKKKISFIRKKVECFDVYPKTKSFGIKTKTRESNLSSSCVRVFSGGSKMASTRLSEKNTMSSAMNGCHFFPPTRNSTIKRLVTYILTKLQTFAPIRSILTRARKN